MITIDGVDYDIGIISLEVKVEALVKEGTARTEDGDLQAELIGMYENFEIVFGSSYDNPEVYAALFRKLKENVLFHTVTVYDELGVLFTQEGYFAGTRHTMTRIKNSKPYFKGLSTSFIAKRPLA